VVKQKRIGLREINFDQFHSFYAILQYPGSWQIMLHRVITGIPHFCSTLFRCWLHPKCLNASWNLASNFAAKVKALNWLAV